jgi:hypothetical protein
MDEKGFMLGQTMKVRVICHRGRRNPCYMKDGNWEMVTVNECISAAGTVIPLMYVYMGRKHIIGWHAGVQDKEQATFAWSSKGWTENESGLEWVEKNFEKFTDQV